VDKYCLQQVAPFGLFAYLYDIPRGGHSGHTHQINCINTQFIQTGGAHAKGLIDKEETTLSADNFDKEK